MAGAYKPHLEASFIAGELAFSSVDEMMAFSVRAGGCHIPLPPLEEGGGKRWALDTKASAIKLVHELSVTELEQLGVIKPEGE